MKNQHTAYEPQRKHTPKQYAPVLDEFMQHTERTGYSDATQKYMDVHLREFLCWCETKHLPLDVVRKEHLYLYSQHLEKRPVGKRGGATLSPASIQHQLGSVRTLFGWLEDTGMVSYGSVSGLKPEKLQYTQRGWLTEEEVRHLFASCNRPRNRALLALLYGCGLRRMEAAALNVEDIHIEAGILHVRSGKGGRSRTVPVSAGTSTELTAYLNRERNFLVRDNSDKTTFLLNYTGSRMHPLYISEHVTKLGRIAGLQVSPHMLRHSIATHLLQRGMPLEQVRDFLGHKDMSSTEIYTHITEGDLMKLRSVPL